MATGWTTFATFYGYFLGYSSSELSSSDSLSYFFGYYLAGTYYLTTGAVYAGLTYFLATTGGSSLDFI